VAAMTGALAPTVLATVVTLGISSKKVGLA
jgi:hypothetical protein